MHFVLLPSHLSPSCSFLLFFFFNDTATTEIYTLSLHDALPISPPATPISPEGLHRSTSPWPSPSRDRKSTRLNSSHLGISYAVFCLKKKKKRKNSKQHVIDHHMHQYTIDISPRPSTNKRVCPCL